MSGKSSGRTSRSSTSPQPSALLPLSYQSSGFDDDTRAESTQPRLNADNAPSNAIDEIQATNAAHESYEDYEHARKRPRRSGGFLLRSAFHSGYDSLRTKDMAYENTGQVKDKGKAKADEDELSVPKRRHLRRHHQLKPSIGSSPLANEVLNAASATGANDKGTSNGVKTLSAASKAGKSVRSSVDSSDIISTGAQSEAVGSTSLEGVPTLGLNTDPAQIVNLALSLSESRRRNFSGGLLSPTRTHGDNRVISAGSLNTGFSSLAGGGSLRQQLEQQRRISRHVSPRTSKRGSRASPSPQPSQESKDSGYSPVVPDIELTARPDLIFTPSDATLSRAEKARVAIELGYEYRRLLQYLPKLPPTSEERPKTARSARKPSPESSQDLGRPYNPLQYIRNRKVRLRQGRALESEAERWKDVDKVRNWIDSVAGEREAGIATIDDPFPLPPFESIPDLTSTVNGMPSLINQKPNTAQSSKPRRPRIEWVFSNWDLLADAYWLQHDGNVAHIEDRRGNKILANPQNYKGSSARTSAEIDRASQRRSDSISRQAISPEKYRSLMDEARKETSKEQTRQETQYIESEASSRHGDGPKDRKSRWPRKFMRSRSSLSSGESDYEESTRHKLGRHRDQDYMNSAILEKHMRKLLEQEIQEKGTNLDRQSQDKTKIVDSKLDGPSSIRTTNGMVAKSWSPSVIPLPVYKI